MNRLDKYIYTHDQIDKILKSNRAIKYRFELLDKNNIALGEISATGNINFNAECEIMRCSTLSIKEINDIDYVNSRIKVYMQVRTPSGYIEYSLGVFLIASPSRQSTGTSITRSLECYDFAQILKEDKFTSRYYIAKGLNYVQSVISILESAKLFSHDITVSQLTTNVDIEFDIGISKLEAINMLLKAVNYTPLWFDENGTAKSSVYISPINRIEEYSYITDKESIIFSGASQNIDTFNLPNTIIRYTDNPETGFLRASWINNNPSSKLSTISRGRNIVDIASVSDIANQSTLEQYVKRLADEQSLYEQVSFDTATMPHHTYMNCLRIENKELGINDTYIEYEWDLELTVGGKMNHKCRKLVSL